MQARNPQQDPSQVSLVELKGELKDAQNALSKELGSIQLGSTRMETLEVRIRTIFSA